jgi:hypothetical protein
MYVVMESILKYRIFLFNFLILSGNLLYNLIPVVTAIFLINIGFAELNTEVQTLGCIVDVSAVARSV